MTVNSNSPQPDIVDLYTILRSHVDQSKIENIDYQSLKYAVYARKSTIGDERQEHSIEDQIDLCAKHCAVPDNLMVVQTIREKGSAKEPDIRPQFSKLINDIKNGQVQGIIAYHPDRLSRNMKEAGELIDLLDKGVLKDLRFATSAFENSPTGKMLLGISFVLSKQYSENLSQVVTRGNVEATEKRGQFLGKRVHGYRILAYNRQLEPDGEYFVIVSKIFEMRLAGKTQTDIAKWANTQDYGVRRFGKEPEPYKWDKSKISDLLRDPVYAGILKYGQSVTKLNDHYDFTPIITEEEFLRINRIGDFKSGKIKSNNRGLRTGKIRADLLRKMVICGHCDKPMSSGITLKKSTNGKKTEYYYYRCETSYCEKRNKSVRAKVVVEFAITFLKDHLFTTPENYEHYKQEARLDSEQRRKELNSIIGMLSKQKGDKNREYERAKQIKITDPDGVGKHYDLDEIKADLDGISADLEKAVVVREQLSTSILTYEKYLELFSNIGEILEMAVSKSVNMNALDSILRKFFSNFILQTTADDKLQWSVSDCKLKEPWNGFLKSEQVVRGRGDRT